MIAEPEALEIGCAQVRAACDAGLGVRPMAVLNHTVAQSMPTIPDEEHRVYEEA